MALLTATTKKGQTLKIDFKDYSKASYDQSNTFFTVSYKDKEVDIRGSKIKYNPGNERVSLHLNSRETKEILGVEISEKKEAAIGIDQENPKEVINEKIREKIESEIDSLQDSDPITLYEFSGYGMQYSLRSPKLSFDAEKKAGQGYEKTIFELNKDKQEPAPELNSDIGNKVEITWGEYKKEIEAIEAKKRLRKRKQEKELEEKFEEAKRTGQPVKLETITMEEEDLPKNKREEESSLAFVTRFAMPDGSTKEEINHAY